MNEEDNIESEEVVRMRYKVNCQECGKTIRGTSIEHLLANLKLHKAISCKNKEVSQNE